jgi:biotin transport system substrate-specific component
MSATASPRTLVSQSIVALLAALFVGLSAWFSFPIPGTDIPQTGQTVAVLAVGALLGARTGSAAIALYLLLGAIGLPVYSDGGSGWSVLFGASSGYFAGFVLAAALLGTLTSRSSNSIAIKAVQLFAAMVIGHVLILFCGFLGLSLQSGFMTAWEQGVVPFLYGGFVKSVIAMLLVLLVQPLAPALRLQIN